MKISSTAKLALAFAAMVALSGFATTAHAQTIYSDPLTGNGTDTLNGSTVPSGTGAGTAWVADSNYIRGASGTGWVSGTSYAGASAFLPFTPTVGNSYVLSTTVLPYIDAQGDGLTNGGIGFTSLNNLSQGVDGISGPTAVGYLNSNNEDIIVVNGGLAADNTYTVPPATDPINLIVDLTASGSSWNTSVEAIDETTSAVLFNTGPYAVTGAINYVGFESLANTYGATDFNLTEDSTPVPEPSTWTLMGFGLIALVFFQRRRRAKNGAAA